MKFSDIAYKRPDCEQIAKELSYLIDVFDKCENAEDQYQIYLKSYDLFTDCDTQFALVRIRSRIDTTDEFYKKEFSFFNHSYPTLMVLYSEITKKFLSSKYRPELEEKIGKFHFEEFELSVKTNSDLILEDKREESDLVQKYTGLISGLSTEFEGEKMSLSRLAAYKESLDTDTRRKAYLAEAECFNSVKEEFDEIFDKLVKCRDKQAKKLGFSDYADFSYTKMNRICYNNDDVAELKKQITTSLVPMLSSIKENRRKRLNLDKLTFSDLSLTFKEGSPKLCVHGDELLQTGKKMYDKISKKFGDFMSLMIENELFDTDSKIGKSPGGFCSYLRKYNYPFIFANFNGTPTDAYVIFHEFGHAYAKYSANKKYGYNENSSFPTDISECHSMSMEFLTFPWIDMFFGKDTSKYKLSQIENALIFLPYACQVDEFQLKIYQNPDLTPKERDKLWLEVEKTFRPDIDYDNLPFYKDGCAWQRQQHIFRTPFYYIDYCLAEIVALQFFIKSLDSYENALQLYFNFVDLASSKSFIDICHQSQIFSPFDCKNLDIVFDKVASWIKKNQIM